MSSQRVCRQIVSRVHRMAIEKAIYNCDRVLVISVTPTAAANRGASGCYAFLVKSACDPRFHNQLSEKILMEEQNVGFDGEEVFVGFGFFAEPGEHQRVGVACEFETYELCEHSYGFQRVYDWFHVT